ncbi:unnamed protein product [Choristocarpus tenellus]
MARFVGDASVPDGSSLPKDTHFTKTWEMRNDGDMAFPEECRLIPVGGDLMSGPSEGVRIGSALPGEDFHVNVQLTSPSTSGRYIGYWRLCSPQGKKFGHRIWADIRVVEDPVNLLGVDRTVSLVEDSDWDIVSPEHIPPSKMMNQSAEDPKVSSPAKEAGDVTTDPTNAPRSYDNVINTVVNTPPQGEEESKSSDAEVEAEKGSFDTNPFVGVPVLGPVEVASGEADTEVLKGPDYNTLPPPSSSPSPPAPTSDDPVTASTQPQPSYGLYLKWRSELGSLLEMGFTDTTRNINLLEKHLSMPGGPGLDKVLDELVSWHERRFD